MVVTFCILAGFLEEVNSIQRKVSDPNTPLVVLCGTGAGRGGVLILSDLLLHAADSGHVSFTIIFISLWNFMKFLLNFVL